MLVKRGYCSIIDQLLASVDQETCRQFSVKNELKPIKQCMCTMLLYQDVLYIVLPICVGRTYLQVPTATNWKTDRSPALCDEYCVGSSINAVIYYIL